MFLCRITASKSLQFWNSIAPMPELPEVEVLRRSLERHLPGERIERVEIHAPALREPLDRSTLERLTAGRRVEGLRRRAKFLWIDLSGGATLVVHLGMSGRLTVVPGDAPREPHEHLAFHLASGRRLRFRDPRRFGQVFALATAALAEDRHFLHLGIEPLEGGLDGEHLRRHAQGRRGPVKTFLMDARVVVGVGNIYAAEALFRAGIHPTRSVARIGEARWQRLATEVRDVLAGAVEQGGTTLNDFTDGEGNAGYFQITLSVYGREGEPCPACHTPIRRIVQANRSTFYCPRCQR
jgi:formamidopyrimidine-DNA glycosylase